LQTQKQLRFSKITKVMGGLKKLSFAWNGMQLKSDDIPPKNCNGTTPLNPTELQVFLPVTVLILPLQSFLFLIAVQLT